MSLVYLDPSAILKLVVDEPESRSLREYLSSRLGRATSIVGAVESRRITRRRRPDLEDQTEFLLGGVEIIELDTRGAAAASTLQPTTLRTLDAIHVAAARELGSDLEALVSYDERMLEAARSAGLPVASPGR